MYRSMDEQHLIDRLRALGNPDLDPTITSEHLAAAEAGDLGSRRMGRVALIAACTVLLAAPVAAAALGGGGAPDPENLPAAAARPIQPEEDDLDGQEEPDLDGQGAEDDAADRPECAGPPPFAGVPAQPADPANGVVPSPRALEARAFAAERRACNGEPDDDVDDAEEGGDLPEGVPGGPPEGTPGPPEGRDRGLARAGTHRAGGHPHRAAGGHPHRAAGGRAAGGGWRRQRRGGSRGRGPGAPCPGWDRRRRVTDPAVPLVLDPRAVSAPVAEVAGDRSLEQVYRSLAPAVLGYFRSKSAVDPEDLVGEVFVSVARGLHRFRGDSDDLRRWVFTIARRRWVDDIRRRTVRLRRSHEELPGLPAADAPSALDPDLVRALQRLTPLQREVVLLRFVADLPTNDVARILRRTEGAVKALQVRALAQLSQQLS